MRGKKIRPLHFLGAVVLLVSLACGVGSSPSTDAPQPPAVTESPAEVTQPPVETTPSHAR